MRAASVMACVLVACGAPSRPAPLPPPEPAPTPTPAPAPKPEVPMEPAYQAVTQTATPQELAFPVDELRNAQPKAGAPRPFRLPKVKPFTLKSGMKVYLVEQHALPIVSMDLNFDGGSLLDAKGKEGLASVCMSMLTEGTEKLDKIQYAEALADIASNIGSYAADDSLGVTLSSLSKHLDPTFKLLVETLRTPAFRASDFERMIKRRQESVRQSKGNPASVAGRVAGAVLYGPAHPFGTVVTEETLKAITIEDCKQLVASALKPAGARLFVVGDLTEAQIRSYFDKGELASWKGAAPKLPALPKPKTLDGRIFFVIPWGSNNTRSLVGTTDADHSGNANDVHISPEEVHYIREVAAAVFPHSRDIEPIAAYSSLRPLVKTGQQSATKTSREHRIFEDPPGVVRITGGKFTTYRVMSAEAADLAWPELAATSRTGEVALGGNSAEAFAAVEEQVDLIAARMAIYRSDIEMIVKMFGVQGPWVASRAPAEGASDERSLMAVLDWTLEHELIQRMPDFLFVSTYLGHEQRWDERLLAHLAADMGARLGWDEKRQSEEVDLTLRIAKMPKS